MVSQFCWGEERTSHAEVLTLTSQQGAVWAGRSPSEGAGKNLGREQTSSTLWNFEKIFAKALLQT